MRFFKNDESAPLGDTYCSESKLTSGNFGVLLLQLVVCGPKFNQLKLKKMFAQRFALIMCMV